MHSSVFTSRSRLNKGRLNFVMLDIAGVQSHAGQACTADAFPNTYSPRQATNSDRQDVGCAALALCCAQMQEERDDDIR